MDMTEAKALLVDIAPDETGLVTADALINWLYANDYEILHPGELAEILQDYDATAEEL
jgi:hypothetical protein